LKKRGKKQEKEARSWSRCTFFHFDADIKSVQLISTNSISSISSISSIYVDTICWWTISTVAGPAGQTLCDRMMLQVPGCCFATRILRALRKSTTTGRRVHICNSLVALGLGRGSRIHEHAEYAHSTPKFHEILVPREASWDHVRSLVCWRISTAIARAPCPIYLNKDFIIPPGQHTWATQPLEVIGRPVVWLFVQVQCRMMPYVLWWCSSMMIDHLQYFLAYGIICFFCLFLRCPFVSFVRISSGIR
jgi:hypothetical protein